ncbi:hypothetical protein [Pyrobaculum sp.]|uniref:hypothetical protein n=1 Tax=Pyrobaculum sp. TaxID=2004705 RepID=UPI003167F9B0
MVVDILGVVDHIKTLGPKRKWPRRSRTDAWSVLVAEFLLIQTDTPKAAQVYESLF